MDYERIMTEGDLIDYVRAQEQLAAMRTIARRMPYKAKSLRVAMSTHTETLAVLAMRYGA